MKASTAIELGKLALKFGRVERATFHEDGIRPETDTDHTVMLGLIAMQVASDLDWNHYSRGMVAQYVFVHDLVEAECGDTNSFAIDEQARKEKDLREAQAMAVLRDRFAYTASWIIWLIDEYERQELPEARLVKYLDKAMPKITHALNECAAIKKMGKTQEELVEAHTAQDELLAEQYPEFTDGSVQILLQDLMVESEAAWGSSDAL